MLIKVIGSEVFDALPEREKVITFGIIFAGCMCHKDLTTFKYASLALQGIWIKAIFDSNTEQWTIELDVDNAPVLLANKANADIIRLAENPDDAAVQKALDSSVRGGVKAASLMGMLFPNSNNALP